MMQLKIKYKFLHVTILWLSASIVTLAQVPQPKLWWSFDYASRGTVLIGYFEAYDAQGEGLDIWASNSLSSGGGGPYSFAEIDRHGNADDAVRFTEDGAIAFQDNTDYKGSFYGLRNFVGNPDAVTISLWVKYDGPRNSDRWLFWAKNKSIDVNSRFGIKLKGEKLYLDRYHEKWEKKGDPGSSKSVDKAWSYELFPPAAFDAGPGWYHVIAVFSKKQRYMHIFVGKPNGGANYGPANNPNYPGSNQLTQEFGGRLIWMPGYTDDVRYFSIWKIAGPGTDLVYDDLMIFDSALTIEQAKALWNDQKPGGAANRVASSARVAEDDEADEAQAEETPEKETFPDFQLYPNPNGGQFSVAFSLPEGGNVAYSVHSLAGLEVFRHQRLCAGGENVLDINIPGKITPGVYVLKMNHQNFEQEHTILIE